MKLVPGKLYKARYDYELLLLVTDLESETQDRWLRPDEPILLISTKMDPETYSRAGLDRHIENYVMALWDEKVWAVERDEIKPV